MIRTRRRQKQLAAMKALREKKNDEDREFFKGWQPVTQMIPKDCEESVRVGLAIRAIPKLCWHNSRRVVQKLDDYQEASYVEGIACLDGVILIEHGWVCRPDGTLIDPTLPTADCVYFPGLEFQGRTGITEFLVTPRGRKCKDSPFFYAFGWGGEYSPGMSQAWERGWAYQRERFPEAFKDSKLGK